MTPLEGGGPTPNDCIAILDEMYADIEKACERIERTHGDHIWHAQTQARGCFSDLPPNMMKPAANQAFGSRSSFWQQMKKNLQKLFSEDGLYFWRQKNLPPKVGGKSLFAGNAGFIIFGSKSLKRPLTSPPHFHVMAKRGQIERRERKDQSIRNKKPYKKRKFYTILRKPIKRQKQRQRQRQKQKQR